METWRFFTSKLFADSASPSASNPVLESQQGEIITQGIGDSCDEDVRV